LGSLLGFWGQIKLENFGFGESSLGPAKLGCTYLGAVVWVLIQKL
jgi:hypothetical protein